jgi:hypothetical protein
MGYGECSMGRRLTGSALIAHIREAHGAQLADSDLFERLEDQAEYVHAAMHNSRAHPGHFHHEAQVLHLWDATDEIEQIDTSGLT